MIFAMVFTISCSGDKGARGPAGINGKGCNAKAMPNPAEGWILYCGDDPEPVGNIWNGKNADGTLPGDDTPPCRVAPSATPGFAFSLNCGPTVVNIPAASSGGGGGGGGNCSVSQASEYNPFWLVMNCGSTINICLNGGAFDPEDQVCTNGAKRTVDINRDYYNRGGYYSDIVLGSTGNLINDLVTSTIVYDANSSSSTVSGGGKENTFPSITSGILLPKKAFICNEYTGNEPYPIDAQNRYYDPNKQFCYANNAPAYTNNPPNGSGSPYKLKDLCGANDFLATKKFCFESKTGFKIVVSLCGGGTDGTGGSTFLYNQFCQPERTALGDGVSTASGVSTITGLQRYNHSKSKVMPLCGNNDWTGRIVTGTNDEIINYNPGVYYDSWLPTVYDYGKAYDEVYGFTKNGTIAGGQQICDTDGIVKTKCGIPSTSAAGASAVWTNNKILLFDARTQFCRDDIKFDPQDNSSNAYTQKVEVINLCRKTDSTYVNNRGGNPFDSKDYFCDNSDGKVKKKCLETFYEDATQFCYKEGNTPIAVGNKCRKNPSAQAGDAEYGEYLPAQYDPRKQFCTIKIGTLPTSNPNNVLPAGAALQILNGQVQNGINVGSSWVNSTSSVVLQTNYTTNAFPNVYIAPTLSGNTPQGGTVGYTYIEVPEDMCQNSIKYNSGNWLWQSCLVTNVQDRSKDRYLHCGIGERPKEDFSGCEKIPAIPTVSCTNGEVVGWNGLSCVAQTVCTSISGGRVASNACACENGYVIDNRDTPTKCRISAFGSTNASPTWCDYGKVQAPGLAADGTGCLASAAACATANGLAEPTNGVCVCANVWIGNDAGTAATDNVCVSPATGKVFEDENNSNQVWGTETLAGANAPVAGTTKYCNDATISSTKICAGSVLTCHTETSGGAGDGTCGL